jgi:hypothetical protein
MLCAEQVKTLRCRPGGLALVLRSTDAGKLVTCLALADERERAAFNIDDANGPVWRIDRQCVWNDWDEGVMLPYCPDSALLPIGGEPDPLDTACTRRRDDPYTTVSCEKVV